MNRFSILSIAIIGLTLMACCCGGPMPQQQQRSENAKQPRDNAGDQNDQGQPNEVAKSKINRQNYNRLAEGMSVDEAQDILGSAKEDARGEETLIVSWTSRSVSPTVITATFQNNRLTTKAIIGD